MELTVATLTPGLEAAKKAHNEGRYAEAVRLYTAELAAEEAKPAPGWVQLSHLNNQLGLALDKAGQYDKALAISLKKLGPDHPDVATSFNNIGFVHGSKGQYDKALEHYKKALTIDLKKLGPIHPHTKLVKGQLDALKEELKKKE